jgi:hypothetical protein
MLWWEPWELSAGEIYACIPSLPVKNFGMFLHSNIAEVQLTRPVDVWFKNMVRLLAAKNIPVVGELFLASGTEELEPLGSIAAPRLVGEEFDALALCESLSGIKEYYGTLPDKYDPSLQMAGIKMTNPGISNQQALKELARPFGEDSGILEAWEATAMGISLYPWDASWRLRSVPRNAAGIQVFHQWAVAQILGEVAASPSWKSTRQGLFMATENEVRDPWFFEDIELRCQASASKLSEAIAAFEKISLKTGITSPYHDYFTGTISDLRILEQYVTAIRCYCRESNLAWMMRKYTKTGQTIPASLVARFEEIMKTDIANQKKGYVTRQMNEPTAEEMLALFRKDPAAWANTHLIFQ